MWQTINIAAASLIGVGVAAAFSRNILVLCLAPVVIAAAEAGLIFVARTLAARLPAGAHASVWQALSSFALLIPVVVASISGVAMAALMLAVMRRDRPQIRRLTALDRGGHGPNWRAQNWASGPTDGPRRAAVDRTGAPPFQPQVMIEQPAAPAVTAAPSPAPDPAALGENRRKRPRRRTLLAGVLVLKDGVQAECTIRELSVSGAKVRISATLPTPRTVQLIDLTNAIGHQAQVAWRDGADLGLRFMVSADLRAGGDPAMAQMRSLWRSLSTPSGAPGRDG